MKAIVTRLWAALIILGGIVLNVMAWTPWSPRTAVTAICILLVAIAIKPT